MPGNIGKLVYCLHMLVVGVRLQPVVVNSVVSKVAKRGKMRCACIFPHAWVVPTKHGGLLITEVNDRQILIFFSIHFQLAVKLLSRKSQCNYRCTSFALNLQQGVMNMTLIPNYRCKFPLFFKLEKAIFTDVEYYKIRERSKAIFIFSV